MGKPSIEWHYVSDQAWIVTLNCYSYILQYCGDLLATVITFLFINYFYEDINQWHVKVSVKVNEGKNFLSLHYVFQTLSV